MSTIHIEIESTPYNPCAVRFRPGKHWLAKLECRGFKLEWFMDGEARPTVDAVVLSIEQAVAFAREHRTIESFAKAAKLPLAGASDRARVSQSMSYLLFAGERWDALCARQAGPAVREGPVSEKTPPGANGGAAVAAPTAPPVAIVPPVVKAPASPTFGW